MGEEYNYSGSPASFLYSLNIFSSNPSSLWATNKDAGLFNYAKQFSENTQQVLDQAKFRTGLSLSGSDNYSTALTGKSMVNDAIANTSLTNTVGSEIIPTSGEGTQSLFSKLGGWNTVGLLADTFSALLPEKNEYSGDKGHITLGIDAAYDSISDMLMTIPGTGTLVGGILKGASFVGKGMLALTGGTDGMCVCAGTKVFKANGEIVNIEDLKQEDGIIGWSEDTKEVKPLTISHIIEPRLKECVKITLKSGLILRCSIDHPIYTNLLVFIPAQNLKVGDVVLSIDLDSILYKSEVIDITSIGLLTVYNLQADPDHTYLANGIITHNTTTDAILGSSLLNWTPVSVVNSAFGKTADTIEKDYEAFSEVGSSYTGTESKVDEALTKSGKKYGALSSSARHKANREIEEADRQQKLVASIADEATERSAILSSMAAINGNRKRYSLQGGYNLAAVRVGRSGMSIELIQKAKLIASLPRKLQTGGTAKDPFEYYVSTLPKAQRDSSNFRVRDYWIYNGQPKDFNEAKKKGMFEWVEDFDRDGKSLGWSWHAFTVAKDPNSDEYHFMKSSTHPTVLKELDWYNSDDAKEFRNEYELLRTEPYWKYVKRKKDTTSYKNRGKSTEILLVVPEFQEGGQVNKKSRTLLELIEYAKKENPRFILRMSEPLRYIDLGNGLYATHLMGYEFDPNTLKWYVYSQVQEDDNGNLKLYDFPEAFERALKKKNVLEMTLDEAKLFTESEELPDGTFKGYKAGWPDFFKLKVGKFLKGGSINVIPEGALHARKHNMDMEGITSKGIPVVSNNENGEIEQQAEIEKEEIILRLTVTKKLEELEKKFYDDKTSLKEKDEYALEAGKLLVKEILYNTLDNTNKLL